MDLEETSERAAVVAVGLHPKSDRSALRKMRQEVYLLVILASLLSAVLARFGARVIWPADAMAEVRTELVRSDSVMTARQNVMADTLVAHSAALSLIRQALDSLHRENRSMITIGCRTLSKVDPPGSVMPDTCP